MSQNPNLYPKYPLYIVSKGRYDSRLTSKALEKMGVFYYIVVEEQEYEAYASVIDPKKILILPQKYKEEYDCFDELGLTKSTGPGPARNFVWEHSIQGGHKRHWVMDDNISFFARLHNNLKIQVHTPAYWRAMEDFVDRYENIGMAGPNYCMFVPRKTKYPPFTMNNRIYSCNLILNSLPFRWRGRYNEDTDLSLRILKSGLCTVQFNAFLQNKMPTQVVKGGNTQEFYASEGTMPKSKMLVTMHPDIAKIVWKFHRWHHNVDYTVFKKLKLKRRTDIDWDSISGSNNYNMKLKQL